MSCHLSAAAWLGIGVPGLGPLSVGLWRLAEGCRSGASDEEKEEEPARGFFCVKGGWTPVPFLSPSSSKNSCAHLHTSLGGDRPPACGQPRAWFQEDLCFNQVKRLTAHIVIDLVRIKLITVPIPQFTNLYFNQNLGGKRFTG